MNTFNYLPVGALIEDKIFCAHGGLSPDLDNFEKVNEGKNVLQLKMLSCLVF